MKKTYFKLIVQEKDPKKLGSFLLKNGFSRQALIKARHHGGLVLVNHRRRFNSFKLKIGDEVIFIPANEKDNHWLKASNLPLNIVYETSNYLVVNKPAGVLSIPSKYEDDSAIVNRVLGYFLVHGQNNLKPHIVTRLDRDTSGLVLIGKNAISHARFSKQDKDHFIKKYHAIVHGNFDIEDLTGKVDLPIGKLGDSVKRSIVKNGQKSITQYRVLAQKPGASLVELRLLTGRTHQIRVHMSAIGHPLFGDQMYGIKDQFERQALNCFSLNFLDPFTIKNQKIVIADPSDMKQLWESL